jgi:predicted GNAT family N-acyltransferase
MSYLTVILSSKHIKEHFDCGQQMLNNYLHRQASQDIKRQITACFVILNDHKEVKGYYTLSNASIAKHLLPFQISKKLPPSYENLPVTLLGRLARDLKYPGERLGELLLMDALKRSYEASLNIGSMAIVVDTIDEDAQNFYPKYGFITLPDSGKMFLSMKTVAELFN